MRSYEFSAKSVDKAIKEGLETLGKKQEEVDIKIVNEGGLFKKAKVIINIEDESDFNTSFTKKEDVKKQEEVKEEIKEEVDEEVEPTAELEEKVEKEEVEEKQEETFEEVEEIVKEVVELVEEEQAELEEKENEEIDALEEKRRRFEERHCENNTTSVEFVQGLMNAMKLDAKVSLEEKRDCSSVLIETEDAGKVIGYRGDCLTAIQYLANTIENNANPNAKRVVVDSGDYKQKREETLRNLAIRVANKVSETGRPYKLEPMNAFERRIIHTELQNYPSVDTHSEGVEPNRRIVVTKKK